MFIIAIVGRYTHQPNNKVAFCQTNTDAARKNKLNKHGIKRIVKTLVASSICTLKNQTINCEWFSKRFMRVVRRDIIRLNPCRDKTGFTIFVLARTGNRQFPWWNRAANWRYGRRKWETASPVAQKSLKLMDLFIIATQLSEKSTRWTIV